MGGTIHAQRDGGIGWLVFDHPERRNAVSASMWRELPKAVAELAADDAVRVVVLRGAGETAFVAGADISEFETERTGAAALDYEQRTSEAFLSLAKIEKSVLAMIHGFCVGGGVAISLGADVRYAADDAVFAIPAARLGLGYQMGGLEALVRLVGASAAKEIFFTARQYGADEALRIGLVNAVVAKPELEGFVREAAERIARNAPLTVRSVKQIVGEIGKEASRRDLAAVEAGIAACMESEDYREGMRAFLEKRRPVFRGR